MDRHRTRLIVILSILLREASEFFYLNYLIFYLTFCGLVFGGSVRKEAHLNTSLYLSSLLETEDMPMQFYDYPVGLYCISSPLAIIMFCSGEFYQQQQ